MIIKETHVFTRIIQELISDDEYIKLQETLVCNPESGAVIKGSGGLRKIRWRGSGRGKRGGIRVIYYYIAKDESIYMTYAYKKNRQNDLSKQQLKTLMNIVNEELSHG